MTEDLLDQMQTVQTAPMPAFSGAILGLQGDVLHGWAMDNTQPENRPVIEVLIDGASVALVRADQYEPDAPTGDLYNGFSVQLRQRWLDSARSVTARIANHQYPLDGYLALPAVPSKDSQSISSQVWHSGGLRLGGWCWDPAAPHRHVKVTVMEGDDVIAQVSCDVHNQALAYRATSDHGFSIDLPWEFADGEVHVINILNDLGQPLAGSPIRVCCWDEGIEGLLRKLSPHHDKAIISLLEKVAKEQTLKLPKSVGWDSYPQWYDAFQNTKWQSQAIMRGRVGLLLISQGEAALEAISTSSLGSDLANVHLYRTARCEDVLPALRALIDSGCDRVLPLRAGDRLAPMAASLLSELIDDGSAWGFSDCDCDGPNGGRENPWFKPVWDVDFFIGSDIYSPGSIFSTLIIEQAVKLLEEDSKDLTVSWEKLVAAIALVTERSNKHVSHMPKVLYHRSFGSPRSPEAAEISDERLRAVEWLCEQMHPGTKINRVPGYPALLRPQWALPEKPPKVSLIVPTRDQYKLLHTCVEGLMNETDYPEIEIIIVDNNSSDPETLLYLSELQERGVKILRHPHPFNYSAINNRAVAIATGELIALINNDIEVLQSDWLKDMVTHALRPGIGAVGAKLLWPNGMVQHGGVVVGINGLAAHSGNYLADEDAGYMATNQITRRQQAVTAACLLMRRSLYQELNGLNETYFPVAFNDVDLCQRIHRQGLDIIWSASAKLIHAESASRGKDLSPERRARAEREQRSFIEFWSSPNALDVHYHPSLSQDYLSGPYGGLSLSPLKDVIRKRVRQD